MISKTIFPCLLLYSLLIFWTGCLISCRPNKNETVDIPAPINDGLNVPGAKMLTAQTRKAGQGVYVVTDGAPAFGCEIVVKWSYLVKKPGDTTHYMSLFCEPQATFFVLEGRQLGDSLVFEGFWRRLVNSETGTARFVVAKANGASILLAPGCCQSVAKGAVTFKGTYGEGEAARTQPLTFSFDRPLNKKPFQILAHRGGGRTSDLLPASENSVEIIQLAERLGATGVEIDIRQTKDGTFIIYHDINLNLRLTQKTGLVGAIESYTYDQLSVFVRLFNGEKIPTLIESLDVILNQTALETVWLDSKDVRDMPRLRTIQQTYLQRAAQQGHRLNIYIGLPAQEQVTQFEQLPNHRQLPSICELDTSVAKRINATVWAPRWTLGQQNPSTVAMQQQGRKVFVWTLDVPEFIQQFIQNGSFDGILSNYVPSVAYYHYVQK